MKKLIANVKEKTGIYASGFDPASVAGIMLPVLFVLVVGGGISIYLLWKG